MRVSNQFSTLENLLFLILLYIHNFFLKIKWVTGFAYEKHETILETGFHMSMNYAQFHMHVHMKCNKIANTAFINYRFCRARNLHSFSIQINRLITVDVISIRIKYAI